MLRRALLQSIGWFFAAAVACFAQLKQGDKRYGGYASDLLFAARPTSDGGAILFGRSNSTTNGDKSEVCRGNDDYWAVKVDEDGAKQWDKTFGGSDDEYPRDAVQTRDGGYLFAGCSASGISGDRTEASRGYEDYWIVRTDTNGVKRWDKRYGSASSDYLFSIQQTADGQFILCGGSGGWASGDKSSSSFGYEDFWLVKVDTNGTKLWDRTIGGDGVDRPQALQQTRDGGYILAGFSSSGTNAHKSQPCRGAYDYWIYKTDTNGYRQWDKTFGGMGDDELACLDQTRDGGYILGGFTSTTNDGDVSELPRGGLDYWVVKVDSNGTKQWDHRFGGSSDDQLQSVRQTSDGGYILGGWSSSSNSGDRTECRRGLSSTDKDYWIVKVNENGIKVWDKAIGGQSDDYLYSAWEESGGSYVLAGYSCSAASGEKSEPAWGGSSWDYWIVRLYGRFIFDYDFQGSNALIAWESMTGMTFTLQYNDTVGNDSTWSSVEPANRVGISGMMIGTNVGGAGRATRVFRVVSP